MREASARVLVNVGVPACSERDRIMPCEPGPEQSNIARPGNMNDVRGKVRESFVNARQMAKICRVEAEILLKRNRKSTAREFERPQIVYLSKAFMFGAGAYTKEGKIVCLSKLLKLATPFTS
jgi:hypothetical protein